MADPAPFNYFDMVTDPEGRGTVLGDIDPNSIQGRLNKTFQQGPVQRPAQGSAPAAPPVRKPVRKYDPVKKQHRWDAPPQGHEDSVQSAIGDIPKNIWGTLKEIPGSISSGTGGVFEMMPGQAISNLGSMLGMSLGGQAGPGQQLAGGAITDRPESLKPKAKVQTETEQTNQTDQVAAPVDAKREAMIDSVMRGNPLLTRDEAIVAVDQIFPGGTTIGGGGAGGGAGTGGGIDDTVKKNLVTDLITSDESPFGGSTKEQVSQLYNRFSTVNDEQFDDYKKYQEAHKKLAKENSEYQNARAAKAYGVQKAESDLAIAKKTAVEKSQKHEQSLHDFYFAETATGDKGMPNFKPKGVFYRMQDEIDNQIASLRATSRVDLWDFSDDDSWLGVNWKKTALAVAGLAAMGGQIGLSVGLKGMPNFVGPLLMKAIDADVSSQKTNIAEARMKAAGVGSLFGTLMDGYGKARDAIAHATKGGYQVAAAILESTKAMPLTTDQKKGIDWILQEVKKADSEAAMKTRTGIMSGIKDETAMAVDMEMKSQSLQNLETQEDATKINALVALEGHYSKLSGKALELPADEQKKLSAGFEAIDTIRDIKRMASDLLNEDLGDIEKMGYILIKDFRKQFSDEDDVINKLNNLIKSQKNFVYQLAKVNDPRVSNADFENTEKIAGSPEEESIFSFITGLYNIEYAIKQATLSRLTPVYGTKSFNQYAPRMRISFGQDEAAVMQNFVNSAMAREQASAVPAGQTPSAQQSEAALKRLDVGMNAVRATKYPDLDDMIYKQFLSSQLSSKAAQKILQVRGKTPAQRKEGYAALAAPVGGGITVTSYQGERTSPGGIGSTNHGGIDIKAAVGDPVYSITDGTVVAVIKGKAGWGNYVQVRDLNGNLHLYAHGSNVDYFKKNDKVYAGQQIMAAGKSGTATGPHLHYEVKSSRGSYLPALAFISGHKWVHEDDAKDHKH